MSAESARASSTELLPGRLNVTMIRPEPRMDSSPCSALRRFTMVRSRRGRISSGRAEMPNALNQCSSSWPYWATPRRQLPPGLRSPHSTVPPPRSSR
ncbi:MAG TPA: hypothetical protein VGG16_22105 [Streptosporangiaceae bacterium]